MLIPDVNILISAWRAESSDHDRARRWLEETVAARAPLGLTDLVASGAARVLTLRVPGLGADIHPTLARIERLRQQPGVRLVQPGRRHWGLFASLCRDLDATGNLVPDCFLAAVAIENDATFVSRDRFFARVPGLDWVDLPER